jgi:putative peptidoglycan lipid II flippase
MGFFSQKIFYTIFLSDKFSLSQVTDAGMILLIFLSGLFFFALNKILLNFYYALHNTWLPALVAFIAALVNWCLDFFLVSYFQAFGLALATVFSGIIQTLLFIFFLYKYYSFGLYVNEFLKFLLRCMIQLCVVLMPMFFFYYSGVILINSLFASSIAHFFLLRLGFWLWVGPLCSATGLILFATRRRFGLKLYFLD